MADQLLQSRREGFGPRAQYLASVRGYGLTRITTGFVSRSARVVGEVGVVTFEVLEWFLAQGKPGAALQQGTMVIRRTPDGWRLVH